MSRLRRSALTALLVVFCIGAKHRAVLHPSVPYEPPPRDSFSVADVAAVRIVHVGLDLTVDFDAHRIRGSAIHTIVNSANTDKLVLDTRGLEITAVAIDGQPATWTLATETALGRALTIDIQPETRKVRIDYATSPTAPALHWLTALQTMGDTAPFLYTFTQPDQTRSWIPIQDTPGGRMTYDATVRVPPGLLALMAGTNPVVANDTGVYTFHTDQSFPPYLIALAVGRLQFRALGERTGIYAEPELIDDAVSEIRWLPDLFAAAERLLGPYPFARYDLLFVPGFIAGGMENPMLNFMNTGLILSNDDPDPLPHSFVSHELAHSWGGDLVTCATWSDTWLNEGFATYYDKRFIEEMGHREQAELGYMYDRLAVDQTLNSAAPPAALHYLFQPGDTARAAFSTISYQKGSLFLKMLEDHIGRDEFDAFIREYLRRRSLNWTTDLEFLDALQDVVLDSRPSLAPELRLNEWVYGSGLPANVSVGRSCAIYDRVAVRSNKFRSGASLQSLNPNSWTTLERGVFLGQINDVLPSRMPELDAAFGYSQMETAPVSWLIATVKKNYAPGMPAVERFLIRGDVNILAVYYELNNTPAGRAYAIEIYRQRRDHYAPNLQQYLDQLLNFQQATLPAAA